MSSMFFSNYAPNEKSGSVGSAVGSNFTKPVTPRTSYGSLTSFQSTSTGTNMSNSWVNNNASFGAIGTIGTAPSSSSERRQPFNFMDGNDAGLLNKSVTKRPSYPLLSHRTTNSTIGIESDEPLNTSASDNFPFAMSYGGSTDKLPGQGLDRSMHASSQGKNGNVNSANGGNSILNSSNNPWSSSSSSLSRKESSLSLKRVSGTNLAQSDGNMLTENSMDPSVETAFQNMAKALEEKDETIKELKIQIEATWTAICMSEYDSTKLEGIRGDPAALAHRMIVRLQTLTDENKMLGEMLSHGRAAQKELELGALRRENESLKEKLQATTAGSR